MIHLGEHLERLSSKDLRNFDAHVPLETLRAVVDLATEIGSEGREGKPVGTLLVVGDTRKVMEMSHAIDFNPFRGYPPDKQTCAIRRCASRSRTWRSSTGPSSSAAMAWPRPRACISTPWPRGSR